MSQLWSYIIKLLKQHRLINCESKIFLHFTTILPLIWTVQPPLQITWSSIRYACCSYFPSLSTVVSSAENTWIQRPWITDSLLNGLLFRWNRTISSKYQCWKIYHLYFLKYRSLIFVRSSYIPAKYHFSTCDSLCASVSITITLNT